MRKGKEKKLTVDADQPGVQTRAGFRTCVIYQNPCEDQSNKV
jgi:hypothetical protein